MLSYVLKFRQIGNMSQTNTRWWKTCFFFLLSLHHWSKTQFFFYPFHGKPFGFAVFIFLFDVLLFMRRVKRNIPLTGRLLSLDINHQHGNETVLTKGETDGGIQMQMCVLPLRSLQLNILSITPRPLQRLLNGQLGGRMCKCNGIFRGKRHSIIISTRELLETTARNCAILGS